jgi:hypothetical protein
MLVAYIFFSQKFRKVHILHLLSRSLDYSYLLSKKFLMLDNPFKNFFWLKRKTPWPMLKRQQQSVKVCRKYLGIQ